MRLAQHFPFSTAPVLNVVTIIEPSAIPVTDSTVRKLLAKREIIEVGQLYDDFSSGTYTLTGGSDSPNGKWHAQSISGGSQGVQFDAILGHNVFFLYSGVPSPNPGQTLIPIVLGNTKVTNPVGSIKFRTDVQLRTPPTVFDVAWIYLKYVDSTHLYQFVLKTNGIELDKKDGGSTIVLFTNSTSQKANVGQLYTLDWIIFGNRIRVWLDKVKIIDFVDDGTVGGVPQSGTLAGLGSTGMFNEDAQVVFADSYFNSSSVVITDILARFSTVRRTMTESAISITQTIARKLLALRTPTESGITIIDAISAQKGKSVFLQELHTIITETITAKATKIRSMTESSISVTDSLVTIARRIRSLVQSAIPITESLTRKTFLRRSITESTIPITDILVGAKIITRTAIAFFTARGSVAYEDG